MAKITAADWNTIASGMRVAAEQYKRDRDSMKSDKDAGSLVAQFQRQAEDAERLAAVAEENACG